MVRKSRRFLFIFCLLCVAGWIYIFIASKKNRSFIQNIQEIASDPFLMVSDSTHQTEDSTQIGANEIQNASDIKNTRSSEPFAQTETAVSQLNEEDANEIESFNTYVDVNHTIIKKEDLPKEGKALTVNSFHVNYSLNLRWRMTAVFNTFENGDYITGVELAKLYKKDPTNSQIAKSIVPSFMENNIDRITRVDDALVISTKDPKGIHTKIKIPFVESVKIDIENGSAIYLGQTFLSSEPLFNKSYLMPMVIKDISILHNGEPFPQHGFISGDYYFIDYAETKTAYKIK